MQSTVHWNTCGEVEVGIFHDAKYEGGGWGGVGHMEMS